MTDLEIPEVIHAFVGVGYSDKVIFNVVENEGDFMNTGLSVITHLREDSNAFTAEIIKAQSYNAIKFVFDDRIVLSDYYVGDNKNYESFESIKRLIDSDNNYEYFYIYDVNTDLLLVKTPELDKIVALDYKNADDVLKIINTVK